MTSTTEDYLRAIYQLQEECKPVSTTRLAQELRVTPASVTSMLKKLAKMELIIYKPYKRVKFTEAGYQAALRIIRFHRLAEAYLVDVLDVPWDRVHQEAHKWEHVLSDDIAARLERALGYPSCDPHGDPIPTADGAVPQQTGIRLTELQVGQRAIVTRVQDETPALLQYLGSLGLYPQVALQIMEVAPLQGPLTLRVGDNEKFIGHNAATQVYVMVLE